LFPDDEELTPADAQFCGRLFRRQPSAIKQPEDMTDMRRPKPFLLEDTVHF
jgi:hypothetical protein